MIRDPAAAIAHRRAMMARIEPIPVLAAAVAERLAIRDPLGEWIVQALSGAVRLYLRIGPESHVSRYVWNWRDTDAVIDHLQKAGAGQPRAAQGQT